MLVDMVFVYLGMLVDKVSASPGMWLELAGIAFGAGMFVVLVDKVSGFVRRRVELIGIEVSVALVWGIASFLVDFLKFSSTRQSRSY